MNEFWKGVSYVSGIIAACVLAMIMARLFGVIIRYPAALLGLVGIALAGGIARASFKTYPRTVMAVGIVMLLSLTIGSGILIFTEYDLKSAYNSRPATRCEQSQYMKETMIRNLNACTTGEIICTTKQIESWETWVGKTSAIVDKDCGWMQ